MTNGESRVTKSAAGVGYNLPRYLEWLRACDDPAVVERVEDEPDVELGACYRDPSDGDVVRVVSVEPLEMRAIARDGARVVWTSGAESFRRTYTERVPDPTPAIAPETTNEDRKPRGAKPALALIPWEVVPDQWLPEAIVDSTDPESLISFLLETQGDEFLLDVAAAFAHGAAKYGVDNWRGIAWTPDADREYRSAMLRHLYADAIGEETDPDSGVSHLAHACASAMIHTFHARRTENDR